MVKKSKVRACLTNNYSLTTNSTDQLTNSIRYTKYDIRDTSNDIRYTNFQGGLINETKRRGKRFYQLLEL